ncbi:MAG: hypothetical protein COB37_02605 [Kordiimonadales bacterium]|nr:MAG: hypothetical protein COB37_02605 [Kordiimonadales bacterium]
MLLAAVLGAVAFPTAGLARQDNSDGTSAKKEEAVKLPVEAIPAAAKKQPVTRFFLGGRPALLRQKGPAIGKPKSIVPQPFVPKGSIKIPPAPASKASGIDGFGNAASVEEVAAAAAAGDLGISAAALQTTVPGNEEVLVGAEGEQKTLTASESLPTIGGALTLQDDPVSQNDAELVQNSDVGFETSVLGSIDPSGIALLAAGDGYGADFWQGYDRAAIITRLSDFADNAGSSSLAAIANKVVLSGAILDDEANDEAVLAFIEARLDLLTQLGNRSGYISLLNALPKERDWSSLARHFTNAHLLAGEITDACSVAEVQRETNDDAYWLRMVAFCDATRGNRSGVDFQLDILAEVEDVQPTFFQLIDQILIEAEQQPGSVLPAKVTLPASLRIDVLEAVMARLAGVNVPELALEGVNPLAVGAMLALPGVEDGAKTDLMGMAVRRGWVDGALLAAFARNLTVDGETRDAAAKFVADDDRFTVDAALANLTANVSEEAERDTFLTLAWQRVLGQNYASVGGQSLLKLTADQVPSASLRARIMTRAALVSGDGMLAGRWFLALRSQAAGADAGRDTVLVGLAPLMAVSGTEAAPELTANMISSWWQAQRERTDRFERANMLYTVLEALGEAVEDSAWAQLENGPVVFAGSVPAPAQWRRFLISARNGDAPATLSNTFRLLAEGGAAAVPAALAGSLIGTLHGMGLTKEARMLALEILISQGL